MEAIISSTTALTQKIMTGSPDVSFDLVVGTSHLTLFLLYWRRPGSIAVVDTGLRGCHEIRDSRQSGARAAAREPGSDEHRPAPSWESPVSIGSGPGPADHPGMTKK